MLSLRLLSLHNLYFYLRLMQQARETIADGTFDSFKNNFIQRYTSNKKP